MWSVYTLKRGFQGLLRPGVGWLARRGVTANQVTVAALLLSLLSGGLMWQGREWFVWLGPVLLLRMAMNAADGMLAKEHGQASRLGAFLNEVGDVVADAALYVPFVRIEGVSVAAVCALVWLSGVVEFVGVLGWALGGERRNEGPMGKSDRALVLGVLGTWWGVGLEMQPWVGLVVWGVNGLLVLTLVLRSRKAWQ